MNTQSPSQTKKIIAGSAIAIALIGGGVARTVHGSAATSTTVTQSQAATNTATPATTTSTYQAPISAVS